MPLTDLMKRIINRVFVNYKWADAMPADEVPSEAMVDVYAEQCSARCASDMMAKVEAELAASGTNVQLTEGERKLIHFKLLQACKAHCDRAAEDSIDLRTISEELVEDGEWVDRSPEDYLADYEAEA